jgi:hypothetical protein
VHMAQDGPARILETTEIRGTEEISWRSHYSSADPQQTQEALKRHVVQTYNAKDLGTYHLSGTEDFSRPFDLAIEATDASVATTASKEAIVSMNPWPISTRSCSPPGIKDRRIPRRDPAPMRPDAAR